MSTFGTGSPASNTITGSTSFYKLTLKYGCCNGGTLTVSSGTTLISTNTLTFSGALTVNGPGTLVAQGDVSSSGSITGDISLTLSGTASQALTPSGGLPTGTLTINKTSGTVTLGANLPLSGSGQDLNLTAGTLNLSGFNLTVNDTMTISSGATLKLQGGETVSIGTKTFNSGSTVEYTGSSTYNSLSAGSSYSNLTFSGSGIFKEGANTTVSGTLTIGSNSTFDLNGFNLNNTGGSFINNGVFSLQGGETLTGFTNDTDSGTVIYNGSGTYTSLAAGNIYNHLQFNGSGSWKPNGTVTVNGNLRIQNGTFDGNSQTINVAGNWRNDATFTSNLSTVILNGADQYIRGNNTFYNLTKIVTSTASLIFQEGVTQVISNILTLQGAANQLLNLVSTTTNVQWLLDPQGTRDLGYLYVQDSNNINSTEIVTSGLNITDGGNNTGWLFNSAPDTPTNLGPANLVNGSYINNTTPTFNFTLADSEPGQVKYQIQISTSADFSALVVDYTSGFINQGVTYFTVGQNPSTGSYATGSQNQNLVDNNYYWRVRAYDAGVTPSSYATANSGSIAFILDSTNPPGVSLISPENGQNLTSNRPAFQFNALSQSSDVAGISGYTLSVSNSNGTSFNINIPFQSASSIITSQYTITYNGFNDSIQNNEYITVTTQSSPNWCLNCNDGQVGSAGTWTVTATDNAGNQSTSSRTFTYGQAPTPSPTPSSNPSGSTSVPSSSSSSDQSEFIEEVIEVVGEITPKVPELSFNEAEISIYGRAFERAFANLQAGLEAFVYGFYSNSYAFLSHFSNIELPQFRAGEYLASIFGKYVINPSVSLARSTANLSNQMSHTLISLTNRIKHSTEIYVALLTNQDKTQITNVKISNITKSTAIVSWETNYPADSKINFGTSPSYGESIHQEDLTKYHQITLTNLQPNKNYFFEVMSYGKDYAFDAYYIFKTNEE